MTCDDGVVPLLYLTLRIFSTINSPNALLALRSTTKWKLPHKPQEASVVIIAFFFSDKNSGKDLIAGHTEVAFEVHMSEL